MAVLPIVHDSTCIRLLKVALAKYSYVQQMQFQTVQMLNATNCCHACQCQLDATMTRNQSNLASCCKTDSSPSWTEEGEHTTAYPTCYHILNDTVSDKELQKNRSATKYLQQVHAAATAATGQLRCMEGMEVQALHQAINISPSQTNVKPADSCQRLDMHVTLAVVANSCYRREQLTVM